MKLEWFKYVWELINKIHPETRSLIILILFGWIMYSQITSEIAEQIDKKHNQEIVSNKKAEQYSRETAIEINQQVQLCGLPVQFLCG